MTVNDLQVAMINSKVFTRSVDLLKAMLSNPGLFSLPAALVVARTVNLVWALRGTTPAERPEIIKALNHRSWWSFGRQIGS